MSERSKIPQNDTIFSYTEHLSSLRRAARLMKAKFIAYRFSKWMIVTLICFGLLTAGTLHATAGSYKSGGHKVHKSVKASARGGIHTGGSHSKASVRNNNSIHINSGRSGGGGGHFRAIKRGGGGGKNHRNNNHKNNNHKNGNNGNGGNNGGKKRVVRKHVKNFDTNTNIDQTIVNKKFTTEKYYPYDSCGMYDCDEDYSEDYDNCEEYDCQDYSDEYPKEEDYSYYNTEDFGDWSDDCGCWSDTNEEVINNNMLTNDSYNSQYVEIRN